MYKVTATPKNCRKMQHVHKTHPLGAFAATTTAPSLTAANMFCSIFAEIVGLGKYVQPFETMDCDEGGYL